MAKANIDYDKTDKKSQNLEISKLEGIKDDFSGYKVVGALENNEYIFKDRIYKTLFDNETLHYKYVSENIDKHLKLLNI